MLVVVAKNKCYTGGVFSVWGILAALCGVVIFAMAISCCVCWVIVSLLGFLLRG
jgi:hypothetical protein